MESQPLPIHSNLDENVIVTSARTKLRLNYAGAGSRTVAYLADWLILLVGWISIALVLTYVGLFGEIILSADAGVQLNKALLGIFAILFYLGNWAYFVLFETFWQGQTPGKRLAGLRVTTDDGMPIGFGHAVLRTTLRIVDFLPLMYSLGITIMLLNRRSKRIGDFVAGTVVLRDVVVNLPAPYLSPEAEFRTLSPSLIECSKSLSDAELDLIMSYLSRRTGFSGRARQMLSRGIIERLCSSHDAFVEVADQRDARLMPEQFLEDLFRALGK